jgi:hypothetical protein
MIEILKLIVNNAQRDYAQQSIAASRGVPRSASAPRYEVGAPAHFHLRGYASAKTSAMLGR